jgi:ADP-ribose pyrophosphatase
MGMKMKNITAHVGKHFNVYTTDSGWEFVSRKKFRTFNEGNRKADAVIIVPIIRGENGNHKIVVTSEWREPIGEWFWGFPAGLIDDGEDPLVSAKRELKEETGLDCVKILHTTPKLFSSEGLTDECAFVVYMEVSGELTQDNLESAEHIESFVFKGNEVASLISDYSFNFGKGGYFIMRDFVNSGFNWLMDGE